MPFPDAVSSFVPCVIRGTLCGAVAPRPSERHGEHCPTLGNATEGVPYSATCRANRQAAGRHRIFAPRPARGSCVELLVHFYAINSLGEKPNMTTALTTELLPEVAELLTENPVPGVIGGEDVLAGNGATFTTRDPGSGQPLAEVTAMQAFDVDRAVRRPSGHSTRAAGRGCRPTSAACSCTDWPMPLNATRTFLVQIEALDTGKIPAQAEWEVQDFADTLRYYTDLALHVQRRSPLAISGNEVWISRQPWGPCAFIFPWNFPVLLMGWNLSPALAAGNTVIVKPPEDAPLGGHLSGPAGPRGRHS